MRGSWWCVITLVIGVAGVGVAGEMGVTTRDRPEVQPSPTGERSGPHEPTLGEQGIGLDDQRAVWSSTFGGTSSDQFYSVRQTTDGGYIVVGDEDSWGQGSSDGWVMKLDASGSKVWSKTFGGWNVDRFQSVQQTGDSGYIVGGDESSWGQGWHDAWVMRLDSLGGTVWSTTFGGTNGDFFCSVQQTTDGGYIVAGEEQSWGQGSYDGWVMKLDSSGSKVWSRTFGGLSDDCFKSVQETMDGGYIVAGFEDSWGQGSYDGWVMKLDSSGSKVWSRTFGGAANDGFYSVHETADGGYIVAGSEASWGQGGCDAWVMKLDSSGSKVWSRTFGGTSHDLFYSVQQTTDGGYIVAGDEESWGQGNCDGWVMKLDSSGSKVWSRTLGGPRDDRLRSVQQTTDGGYTVAGSSGGDGWVVKLDSSGNR